MFRSSAATPGEVGLDHGLRAVAAVVDVDPRAEAGAPCASPARVQTSPNSSSICAPHPLEVREGIPRGAFGLGYTRSRPLRRPPLDAPPSGLRIRRPRGPPRSGRRTPRFAHLRTHSSSSSSETWVSSTRLTSRPLGVLARLLRGQVPALAGALRARQRRLDDQQVGVPARTRPACSFGRAVGAVGDPAASVRRGDVDRERLGEVRHASRT